MGASGNRSGLTSALSCQRIKIQVDAACEGNPVVGIQKQGNDRRNVKRRAGALFFVCATCRETHQ